MKLDGKVSDESQKIINEAKKEMSFGFDLPIMNEIIKQSENIGKLYWSYKQIRSCNLCDKKPDYYRYPRSGRNHRKGDKNYNSPIYYSGIKFNEGFISIQGFGDMCSDCCSKYKVKEQLIDYIIENDLKIEIMKNDYMVSKYLKDDIRICYSCETEMQESKMGRSRTMMGDGSYPSKCPNCGAESLILGNNHKPTNKFEMIENPENKTEIHEIKRIISNLNLEREKGDKILFYKSNYDDQTFIAKEEKFTNGYRHVLGINTQKNTYSLGAFYEGKFNEYEEYLKSLGYTKVK